MTGSDFEATLSITKYKGFPGVTQPKHTGGGRDREIQYLPKVTVSCLLEWLEVAATVNFGIKHGYSVVYLATVAVAKPFQRSS